MHLYFAIFLPLVRPPQQSIHIISSLKSGNQGTFFDGKCKLKPVWSDSKLLKGARRSRRPCFGSSALSWLASPAGTGRSSILVLKGHVQGVSPTLEPLAAQWLRGGQLRWVSGTRLPVTDIVPWTQKSEAGFWWTVIKTLDLLTPNHPSVYQRWYYTVWPSS